jgi:putative SOS response-associated peptidase YedK
VQAFRAVLLGGGDRRSLRSGRGARVAAERWLDPANQDVPSLQGLLQPYPADTLFARQMSTLVNNHRHDDQRCIHDVGA